MKRLCSAFWSPALGSSLSFSWAYFTSVLGSYCVYVFCQFAVNLAFSFDDLSTYVSTLSRTDEEAK